MRITGLSLALALVLISLVGCEESVNPVLESNRNYSLFGTLDLESDTQWVRVAPISPVLEPSATGPLNVRFTSVDLSQPDTTVWRDSIFTFADGSSGHVFYAPMRIQLGHTYRLTLEDPDEAEPTWVETTVPEMIEPNVLPATIFGGVGGAIARGTQSVQWEGLDRQPFRIETWYRFLIAERTPFIDVLLPYEPGVNSAPANAWEVAMDLRKDRLTLDTLFQVREHPLVNVGLRLTLLDRSFVPPGGVFDPEVLAQPGTFSNVQNGFGFVGSVARFSVEWVLPRGDQLRLGYVPLEDVFGTGAAAIRRQARAVPYGTALQSQPQDVVVVPGYLPQRP